MYGFVSGVAGVSSQRVGAQCSGFVSPVAVRPVRASRALRVVPSMAAKVTPPKEEVLGIGIGIPGPVYLALSVAFLAIGGYCVFESNLSSPLTPTTVNPIYVLGSLLLPLSWGCHVAAWIKFQNAKK